MKTKQNLQSFFARHFSPENGAMNIITIAVLTVGAAYIALQILRATGVVNI
jgi:secreted Zn-dependent insulinase-like peptidase